MSKEPSVPREFLATEPSPTAETSPPPPITEPIPTRRAAAMCDVCEGPASDDDDDAGGHGLYVWVRHGEVVYEEPPLCASCASAITLSALRRWDMEEEEG